MDIRLSTQSEMNTLLLAVVNRKQYIEDLLMHNKCSNMDQISILSNQYWDLKVIEAKLLDGGATTILE